MASLTAGTAEQERLRREVFEKIKNESDSRVRDGDPNAAMGQHGARGGESVARRSTQETFDEVVQENAEDMEIEPVEAL